ncbi:MAG: flagellar protein FlaG [Magnetococcales bacterium]|nr:flagellar protein FlaG [Magnetococcales bacterium]
MDNMSEVLPEGKAQRREGKRASLSTKHPPVLPTSKLFEGGISKPHVGVEKRSNTTDLKSLAEEITQSLSGFKSLRLSMDRDMKRVVVRVVDEKTDNVIRQIPGERMIDLVKQMRDLEGVLIKATA